MVCDDADRVDFLISCSLQTVFSSIFSFKAEIFLIQIISLFSSIFLFAEKWMLNESEAQTNGLIATYSFTSPIINVCVTDYVIHALTDHGIETYTHCIGHKLFNNIYEYSMSDDLYNAEVNCVGSLDLFLRFISRKIFLKIFLVMI